MKPHARAPHVETNERGFRVLDDQGLEARALWNEVTKIVAFKIDLWAYDEVRLLIWAERLDAPIEISEEWEGHRDLCKTMEQILPDVLGDWWKRVWFPAFEPCETLLYQRTHQSSCR
jgi:hypothetical protein